MQLENGYLTDVRHVSTTFCDARPDSNGVNLLVIHNISLPPNQFGGPHIEELFTGNLDPSFHPFFAEIHKLRVSAHCVIQRDGNVIQFVPFHLRAWHAGVSSFQGRSNCNDFAIGIELEGADNIPYTDAQYESLSKVSKLIMFNYQDISIGRIVGHEDIAPFRKTDPGVAFDWCRYRQSLA